MSAVLIVSMSPGVRAFAGYILMFDKRHRITLLYSQLAE